MTAAYGPMKHSANEAGCHSKKSRPPSPPRVLSRGLECAQGETVFKDRAPSTTQNWVFENRVAGNSRLKDTLENNKTTKPLRGCGGLYKNDKLNCRLLGLPEVTREEQLRTEGPTFHLIRLGSSSHPGHS